MLHPPIDQGELLANVIDCVFGQTLVTKHRMTVGIEDGRVVLPEDDDLCFICVVDRHGQHGGRTFGLVRGLGITHGALATTYAHDSHNLAVIGRSPEEMSLAANTVIGGSDWAVYRRRWAAGTCLTFVRRCPPGRALIFQKISGRRRVVISRPRLSGCVRSHSTWCIPTGSCASLRSRCR